MLDLKNGFEGRKIKSGYPPFPKQVLYRPRQNDRHRVMFGTSLYRYHTATYPHASGSVNRRTNDTIFVASMLWAPRKPAPTPRSGDCGGVLCSTSLAFDDDWDPYEMPVHFNVAFRNSPMTIFEEPGKS
ncbi:hypothetical protein TNCV_5013341 [Trichonephila clavipes]|nr:hypothetical protein TNCV_5013341 [Trichonephila clavipes]